jgi:protein-tyrosine phosphatase
LEKFREDSILFVCLGNICRSPIAEGIAKEFAKNMGIDILIESRGTSNYHVGEGACSNSISVSLEHGINITGHRAKQLSESDLEKFHHIIALDESNFLDIDHPRCIKLGEFGFNGADVPDPYHYRDRDGFLEVFRMIESAVQNLLNEKF